MVKGNASAALASRVESLERSVDLQRGALNRATQRFKRMIAHAGALVMTTSESGQVTKVLRATEELPPLLEGENLSHYLSEPSPTELTDWLAAARVSESPISLLAQTQSVPPQWVKLVASALETPDEPKLLVSARDVSSWKAQEERLITLATHDTLTGLANRAHLRQRISEAIARYRWSREGFALLMLDLDNFKRINDSMGHPAGDSLLQVVAGRMKGCLRETDLIARSGGDEFFCLLHGISDRQSAQAFASRLQAAIQQPIVVEGQSLHVSASIGVTLCPQHGTDIDALTKFADIAMYQSKRGGKGRLSVYSESAEMHSTRALALEAAMHEALTMGEFNLHYQPIFRADGTLAGCEALMRWTREDGTSISPGEFIPLAEEAGLIGMLGSWALKTASKQLADWGDRARGDFYMSVNVSPHQFRASNFVSAVTQALTLTGLPPKQLMLEITEGVLMENPDHAAKTLRQLSGMGISVAVDDFGTGFSSLGYLKSFALDVLKVDQSFVRDIEHSGKDLAIANVIINLAKELGLRVVAEGVEKSPQFKLLADKGCDLYQGWLFSAALPAEQFAEKFLTPEAEPCTV